MNHKILADLIVLVHFAWILFMLAGFFLTVSAFFHRAIFDWWGFRTFHLVGILYVSLLAAMGKFCPLTVSENSLRMKHDPNLVYPGSFIAHYLEKIVYPDVPPRFILIPTFLIALFTVVVYCVRPPVRHKSSKFR